MGVWLSSDLGPESTLGVDLASDPKRTGICVIEWGRVDARLDSLAAGATDQQILDLWTGCDAIGIDSPFGWPEAFREMVAAPHASGNAEWTNAHRDSLRFRRTDHHVRKAIGRWPLSVSSDLIAVPAMRCAGLLAAMGVTDRSGSGGVFEVYPAAALHRWGMPDKGYKKKDGQDVRTRLVSDLLAEASWLALDGDQRQLLNASDDALDALVCALVVRAAMMGLTERPNPEDAEAARTEGWIHLPAAARLGGSFP